jgi:hypothetical protein
MEVEECLQKHNDIVSTFGEKPKKFIRELHRLTTYVKTLEMPPKQLGVSTIIPGMGRILKQYTIDDVKKQLDYTKSIQNDKSAFLKNVGTIRKEDII